MKHAYFIAALLVAACRGGERTPSVPAAADSAPSVDSISVDTAQASARLRLSVYGVRTPLAHATVVDSSTYTVSWRVSGFTAGDTVQVKLVRDSVAGRVTRVNITKNLFLTSGSQAFRVDKIYGTAAKYTSCVRLRRTTVKSELCQSWTSNFATVGKVDTMSVDSSLAMAVLRGVYATSDKKNIQFCLFVKTNDGKVRIADSQQAKPLCQEAYKMFPVAQRFSDYRAFATKDGHWNVTIDGKDTTATIEFIRPVVLSPLLGHPS